jgi:acetyl/propionyl-CoA carboxylase alpha subunit
MRIIQTCNELGMQSVAVYTDDDRAHAKHATVAIRLPSPSSYMDISHIVGIATRGKCTAVAPGYGYLSESAAFAQALEESKIAFAGPSHHVLDILGDKRKAKEVAQQCGVPILPSAPVQTANDIERFAANVGLPIMIKAQDGGGGRGIRIVREMHQIGALMEEALNESPGRLIFCEKAALEGYKHIEIQIVADGHGEVRHLFERECSLQRRFQKVIEFAPSSLSPERIAPLIASSLAMAKKVGYVGLGTFEFLVNARSSEGYYFMECNPRIQVEHTITEQIAGSDLVSLLLKITTDAKFRLANEPWPQTPSGYAVQCRINAEDPTTFEVAQGIITSHAMPGGAGIRVDTLLHGSKTHKVTDQFDSMIVKIITSGATYEQARQRAIYAVRHMQIDGIVTNKALLIGLLRSGMMRRPNLLDIRSLSISGMLERLTNDGMAYVENFDAASQKRLGDDGRPTKAAPLMLAADTSMLFRKDDSYTLTSNSGKKIIKIDRILKNQFPTHLSADISIDGNKPENMVLEKATGNAALERASNDKNHVASPFNGILMEMVAEEGEEVEKGDVLAVFRQQKMELEVRAPRAGIVERVAVIKVGDQVGAGSLVCVMQDETKAKL